LTSIGVAGIPSASLISLVIILHAVGIPAEGVGLIMAVERIVDMFRTTANVLANATCAVMLGVAEGEKSILAKD
jgi:proton glutamate symport protein